MAKQYGETQVLTWQRSYDVPPALEPTDPRSAHGDLRCAKPPPAQIPLTESLRDTVARVMPFWNEALAPAIRMGKRIVVAAHGDSIRAQVKYLDNMSDDDIANLNIPNGLPPVDELDNDLKPFRHYYLGNAIASALTATTVVTQENACFFASCREH